MRRAELPNNLERRVVEGVCHPCAPLFGHDVQPDEPVRANTGSADRLAFELCNDDTRRRILDRVGPADADGVTRKGAPPRREDVTQGCKRRTLLDVGDQRPLVGSRVAQHGHAAIVDSAR